MFTKLLVGAAVALVPLVATPALAWAAPAPVPSAGISAPGTLASGAGLGTNQSVRSPNGRYFLVQQPDGNLVFYSAPSTPIWSTQTTGSGVHTQMQTDGNLVVYSAANKPLFDTATAPNPGASLAVQDDGNLVIYSASRTPLWSRSMGIAKLASNRTLTANQGVSSPNGQYRLLMQGDGNLVLYRGPSPQWSSRTASPGARAVMQADGNLVVVSPANKPLWSTGTAPNPGAYLNVQDDGNLVVYSTSNKPLWSSLGAH